MSVPADPARGAAAPIRFGLAGTGHWARTVHAPALASTPGIELAAIWGRNPDAAGTLAAQFGATAGRDFEVFLGGVDAVAFAVPPAVQADLAIRAADAGRHLLLEKPVALTRDAADALVRAVTAAGVASVVFFTHRFQPDVRRWLAEIARTGGWAGGCASFLGTALADSGPFDTPWRRDFGALWDVGPHAVSLLWVTLGPVCDVTADAGRGDLSYLVLHHENGATSTATLTLSAPQAAAGFRLEVWGEHGISTLPGPADRVAALRVALAELAANARSGETAHPCDVAFGRNVTRVLSAAQRHLEDRRERGSYAQ
jgi:predicted dehydrogenase